MKLNNLKCPSLPKANYKIVNVLQKRAVELNVGFTVSVSSQSFRPAVQESQGIRNDSRIP